MSETALATLAAMLSAGLGYSVGKRQDPRPEGHPVENGEITPLAKRLCKTCRGKGFHVGNRGEPEVCKCALAAFHRKHGRSVVMWRGVPHWRRVA